jgi:DNA-binding protein HU-beta
MNKSDLIEKVAEAADISKAAAGRAVEAMTDAIAVELKEDRTVSLIGFGTFAVKKRAARTGRNPKTGETIAIGASKSPAFKAGKALKDAIQ